MSAMLGALISLRGGVEQGSGAPGAAKSPQSKKPSRKDWAFA